jgi:lycopene cyclase CruA
VEQGRQLIWEGFPGRAGETTVYLFYYDRTGREEASKQGLLDLFERYFEELPAYRRMGGRTKDGGVRHVKPVFGYIPARHGRTGRTAARGLLCLGYSAAGQSPLTFCGFGSFVRHIGRVAYLIHYALTNDLLEEGDLRQISPHQANLRVAWVFSRFMRPHAGGDPASVNRLMNVFCGALKELGAEATVRFLQDRYTFAEYLRIMATTARRYPGVFALTARALGARGLGKWAGDIAFFGADEVGRTLFRLAGRQGWRRLERLAGRLAPSIGLRLRARRTGWEAVR